jgi:hypothetical protein
LFGIGRPIFARERNAGKFFGIFRNYPKSILIFRMNIIFWPKPALHFDYTKGNDEDACPLLISVPYE